MRHWAIGFVCFHINKYSCIFRIQPSDLHSCKWLYEVIHLVTCANRSCICGITLVRLHVFHFLSYSLKHTWNLGFWCVCECDKTDRFVQPFPYFSRLANFSIRFCIFMHAQLLLLISCHQCINTQIWHISYRICSFNVKTTASHYGKHILMALKF